MKHSPFPWHVVPTRNGQAWLLVDANGGNVALANCTENAKENMDCIASLTQQSLKTEKLENGEATNLVMP